MKTLLTHLCGGTGGRNLLKLTNDTERPEGGIHDPSAMDVAPLVYKNTRYQLVGKKMGVEQHLGHESES